MERKVYGIGETICDIIFKNNQPQAAKAGGSTFNAMVSLGRLGVPASFICKIGDDMMGNIVIDFMKQNHISTDCMTIWEGHKTDIALAFLNENGDANYSFYKEYDKQFVEASIPDFKKDDILLLGSYFALNPLLRSLVERVLEAANAAKCIIYYDPNFRSSHLHEVDELMPSLLSNMEAATFVRGSDEDFFNIFGIRSIIETKNALSSKVQQLMITKNSEGVDVFDDKAIYHFPAQTLTPLSTIGAGDSFNAGFIYALIKYDVCYEDVERLDESTWTKLVKLAVACSSEVCQSYDNYISPDFAQVLIDM